MSDEKPARCRNCFWPVDEPAPPGAVPTSVTAAELQPVIATALSEGTHSAALAARLAKQFAGRVLIPVLLLCLVAGRAWAQTCPCSGSTTAASIAACTTLTVSGGDTCMVADTWNRPDLVINMLQGTFDTNNQNITVSDLMYSTATGACALTYGSSQIGITHDYGGTTAETITVTPGTSVMTIITGGLHPHDFPLWDVVLTNGSTIGVGNINAHSVTINPGTTVDMSVGHISTGSLTCLGTGPSPIVINGGGTPNDPNRYLNATTLVECEHTTPTNIYCGGSIPCNGRVGSIDGGGNTNWCFGDTGACPAVTWTPTLTPTVTPTETPTPSQTPTATPPQDGNYCCEFANGTGIGGPSPACADNVLVPILAGGLTIGQIGFLNGGDPALGCTIIAGFLDPTTTVTFETASNCAPTPGDPASACAPTATPTVTPTPALKPHVRQPFWLGRDQAIIQQRKSAAKPH